MRVLKVNTLPTFLNAISLGVFTIDGKFHFNIGYFQYIDRFHVYLT